MLFNEQPASSFAPNKLYTASMYTISVDADVFKVLCISLYIAQNKSIILDTVSAKW